MEVPAKFRSVWADFRYLLMALIFIATAAFIASCGSDGTTITINDGAVSGDTSFELTAPSNIITGQSESLSVYVFSLPDGLDGRKVAAPGVSVTFEIYDNQSGGTRDPSNAVTGSDGRAATTYTAGPTIGATDIVRVTVAGVADPQDANITVDPPGGGSLVVAVSASPDTIAAVTDVGAKNQATITATVTSGTGGAIADQSVTFTTTAGTLLGCGTPCVATTNTGGVASVTLQSSTNLETADVQAQVGTASGSTTVSFIPGPAFGFELFASPTNLTADGNSTSAVTAVVTDSADHLVANGTPVNFSIKSTSLNTGRFVEIPATDQTVGGVATVTYIAPTTIDPNSNAVDIRASSGGVDSDDSDPTYGNGLITLITEFVGSVSVVVAPSTLTADGTSIAQVTATVLNSNGVPVTPGTPVTFTTSGGALDTDFNFSNPQTSIDTPTIGILGEASVFLRSSLTAGQYFVTATAGGRADVAQVDFIAGLADANNSSLTVSPSTIPADGTSSAILTLTARDSIGNPVADGKQVGFSTSQGVISNQTTTNAGVATATLTSSSTPGQVNLSASIDTITETATVTFGIAAGANPNSIVLVLSDTTLTVESPTGSDAITIEATVLDGAGNPIGVDCDQNITFTKVAGPADVTLDGSPTSVTKTTNGGVASVTLNSGTTPGTVRVQVTASQDTGNCTSGTPTTVSITTTAIVITSGPAANLLVYPAQNVVDNQDGTISQAMNALLTDSYGNPVEDDTAVFFSLNAAGQLYGTICGSGVTGNSELDTTCNTTGGAGIKGVAHSLMTWVSEGIFEPFIVTAETQTLTGMISDTYDGNFPGVAPIAIDVTITPSSAPGGFGGTGGISVIAEYHDGASFPNPISGVDLAFTSSSAFATVVSTPVTTDINGFASTTVTTTTCRVTNTSVTISASDPPYSGSAQMTIEATEPTASFTVSGTSPTFTFSNTSTEPAGYNYSYLWNFGDATTSTLENPSHTYAASGTYTVTLTVTNNDAPGGCSDTDTDSVTVPVP